MGLRLRLLLELMVFEDDDAACMLAGCLWLRGDVLPDAGVEAQRVPRSRTGHGLAMDWSRTGHGKRDEEEQSCQAAPRGSWRPVSGSGPDEALLRAMLAEPEPARPGPAASLRGPSALGGAQEWGTLLGRAPLGGTAAQRRGQAPPVGRVAPAVRRMSCAADGTCARRRNSCAVLAQAGTGGTRVP